MKTDDLINVLGTNVEPIRGQGLRNTMIVAIGIGAAVALCLMFAIFGVPGDALDREYLPLRVLSLLFTIGLAAAGARFLAAAARPGQAVRKPLIAVGVLFFAAVLACVVALALTPSDARGGMIFGPQWELCLLCIPLFALAPFASLIMALRKGAPTELTYTGAFAGLVAGAVGAAIYAFHHAADSIPFIVLWYGGSIVLCTLAGALLGPRLLRW